MTPLIDLLKAQTAYILEPTLANLTLLIREVSLCSTLLGYLPDDLSPILDP